MRTAAWLASRLPTSLRYQNHGPTDCFTSALQRKLQLQLFCAASTGLPQGHLRLLFAKPPSFLLPPTHEAPNPPAPPRAATLGGGKSSGCRCWVGNLRQQNWVKLKFTSIINVYNSSTSISPRPRLLVGSGLCVIEVVWFSNKGRLKGKVFEVMSF